ncbi:MAG: adenylate/guanylate cyclase domain-containing protein [Fibrella sp.]|nr:adenylate/guanylate cyclase domain-containing protein [Armatimonadota bacterium]
MMTETASPLEKTVHAGSDVIAEVRSAGRLNAEIAHILFLDLVGFSRSLMEQQDRTSRELRALVRATPEFQRAELRGELIGSDTGDGMALIFFRDPLAPIQCAIEIARALKTRPQLQIRMGVHSGPVIRVPDINGNENVSGAGINLAQRLMDCGDNGHILLSAMSAEVVRAFESYSDRLSDLGEVVVKHGEKIHVFNLVLDDVGNPHIPARVRNHGVPTDSGQNPFNRRLAATDSRPAGERYERRKVGSGKTVSLVYKRRGTPTDDSLGKWLETELVRSGFVVRIERQQQFGLTWVSDVEEQFTGSDAIVFLLSAISCANELFEYEVELAAKVAASQGGLNPKLLAIRVGYTEKLTDSLFSTLGQLSAPVWESSADNEAVLQHVLESLTDASKSKLDVTKRERAGGAVPLDSAYYIVRPTDEEFTDAIARQDSIVLVKGGRQMGKTSLLARGLQEARQSGARVILTDFQSLSAPDLRSADELYRALAEKIADDLALDVLPDAVWSNNRSANMNLERYIRKEVLGAIGEGTLLVWGLDEVDRLFTCDFGSEVFGLFRSWHNKRSLDPTGPWSRLTLAIAYATEAHLFITDMNQSPFNVGTRLTLHDFTSEQVAELNVRYGSPMNPSEIVVFHQLIGGQPYLTRRGLDELTANSGLSFAQFAKEAGRDEGVYGDHLRRMYLSLCQDQTLVKGMQVLLGGGSHLGAELFYRLRTAGLVQGESVTDAKIRCRVYEEYLKLHLA